MCACSDEGIPSGPVKPPVPKPAAVKPEAPTSAAKDAGPVFAYEAGARRDPFRALVLPKAETTKVRPKTGLAALEVNELKLVGIVWGQRGYYALVEAPTGAGFVVRANDVIGEDAHVTKITSDGVQFEVKSTAPGPQSAPKSRLVELRLKKEE
jgi:Tfp pilus assembly protein PilP